MSDAEETNLKIAERWCASRGEQWRVVDTAGRGGTAPVFSVESPDGPRAFKLLDKSFCEGNLGDETEKRIALQVERIGTHDCPYLIRIYDGGRFEDRLFLLMNKAEGSELAKCLHQVPDDKIKTIVDQVAKACIYLRSRSFCHRDIKSANIFVSDDFARCTLLDLSVARDVHDPIGIGTDHGGQLPVVATSRYSPPEYLFRLIEPGETLWHALDIYQLGGLIHDLVMKYEMFEKEYILCRENRYRFAYIVATNTPSVFAEGIEPALLLLAARALDKNWERRSTLQLDDFLETKAAKTKLGLGMLGMAPKVQPQARTDPQSLRQISMDTARSIEDSVLTFQRTHKIRSSHEIRPGETDNVRVLRFEWSADSSEVGREKNNLCLEYNIETLKTDRIITKIEAKLTLTNGGEPPREVILALPDTDLQSTTDDKLATRCVAAIADLATMIVE